VYHFYYSKAAADTELPIVSGAVIVTDRADDAAVLDFNVHSATYRAIWTNARDYGCRHALPLAALVS
jgi:hypothetical protein